MPYGDSYMNNDLIKIIVKQQADIWLKENPLLLTAQEKQKFLIGLQNYLENKEDTIDDEVFDFLVQRKLVKNEPRETTFMRYLTEKYRSFKNLRVLDVGAGRTCALSQSISKQGGKVTAMDTNIRLSNDTLKKAKLVVAKKLFMCDDCASNGKGTNIDRFDLIVGLEPCDATEHIIRQAIKYNKAFDISLCASPHKSLDGKTFKTYEEWYDYLSSISKKVSIVKNNCGFVATNSNELELE